MVWYRDGPIGGSLNCHSQAKEGVVQEWSIGGSLNCHSQAEEGVVQGWAYRWKLKLSQSGRRRCGTGMGL
jgi:hypothetical protein